MKTISLCAFLGSVALVRAAAIPSTEAPSAAEDKHLSTNLSPLTHDEFGNQLTPELARQIQEKEAQQAKDKLLQVTALSTSEIDAFKPYTVYAGTAYCPPSKTATWTCGPSCDANPGFEPFASGGDGAVVQFWYVGWDARLSTVIVAHQGTDASRILPILTDVNLIPRPLSPFLFKNVPFGALVHSGFATSHAFSAADVLNAVRTTVEHRNAARVTVVGHSLGAAIAMLSALHLKQHLPSTLDIQFRGFGMPRTGNQRFADYIDKLFGTDGAVQRVANLHDPVPTVPSRVIGFSHTSGEIHITEGNLWNSCSGQDNGDKRCTVGFTPTLLNGTVADHSGPYDGYLMGEGC